MPGGIFQSQYSAGVASPPAPPPALRTTPQPPRTPQGVRSGMAPQPPAVLDCPQGGGQLKRREETMELKSLPPPDSVQSSQPAQQQRKAGSAPPVAQLTKADSISAIVQTLHSQTKSGSWQPDPKLPDAVQSSLHFPDNNGFGNETGNWRVDQIAKMKRALEASRLEEERLANEMRGNERILRHNQNELRHWQAAIQTRDIDIATRHKQEREQMRQFLIQYKDRLDKERQKLYEALAKSVMLNRTLVSVLKQCAACEYEIEGIPCPDSWEERFPAEPEIFQALMADTGAGPAELWGKDTQRQSNVEPTIAKPNAVTTNTENTTFLRQRLDERTNSKIHEREILERFTDMNRRVDLADVNISKKFDANGMFPEQRDFYGVSNETSGHNGRIASSMSGGQTSLYTEDLMIPLRDVLREIDTRASLGASRGEGCGYYGRASFESLSRSRDVTLFDKSQTSFLRPDGQRSSIMMA